MIIPAVIVGFWAAMTALLIEREVLVPRRPPASASNPHVPQAPEDTWLGVYTKSDRRVGYMHATTLREDRQGVAGTRMAVQGQMQLAMFGEASDINVAGSVWSSGDGSESDFDFAMRSEGHDLRLEGRVADGRLDAEVISAGERMPFQMPMERNPLFGSGMAGLLRLPAPKPGEEFMVTTFDPMTLSAAPTRVAYAGRDRITVGAESLPATVVRVTSNGVESRVWVGENDDVLRAETPYGLTLARITPEEAATEIDSEDGARDLVNAMAIRPSGTMPFRGAQDMVFRAEGPDTTLPEDAQQKSLGEGRYSVTAAETPAGAALSSNEAEENLAGDPLVQVDHPKIREWSERIVADAEDPWARAQAIYRWVYDNIEKKPVVSVPSAIEVLKTREGDCNEHTVLFTALARAAGVPTRIAVGLVWSDELRGFYYHAWPEVFVGRWVRMDPTLGQPIADATHVKLATGNIMQWTRLMPFLGRLQLEVTDVR